MGIGGIIDPGCTQLFGRAIYRAVGAEIK